MKLISIVLVSAALATSHGHPSDSKDASKVGGGWPDAVAALVASQTQPPELKTASKVGGGWADVVSALVASQTHPPELKTASGGGWMDVFSTLIASQTPAAAVKSPSEGAGGWRDMLGCFKRSNYKDCLMKQAYLMMHSWVDADPPEVTALEKVEKHVPESEDKGLIDYMVDILMHVAQHLYDETVDNEDEVERSLQGPVEENGDKESNRLLRHRKLLFLIKFFVHVSIAKAKVALVVFKLLVAFKLKFLIVVLMNMLFFLAKSHFDSAHSYLPQKVIVLRRKDPYLHGQGVYGTYVPYEPHGPHWNHGRNGDWPTAEEAGPYGLGVPPSDDATGKLGSCIACDQGSLREFLAAPVQRTDSSGTSAGPGMEPLHPDQDEMTVSDS